MPIVYIHRSNAKLQSRPRNGLKTSKGEFVAIFDADFLPNRFSSPHDSLFHESRCAQYRHGADALTYLNSNYSLLTT